MDPIITFFSNVAMKTTMEFIPLKELQEELIENYTKEEIKEKTLCIEKKETQISVLEEENSDEDKTQIEILKVELATSRSDMEKKQSFLEQFRAMDHHEKTKVIEESFYSIIQYILTETLRGQLYDDLKEAGVKKSDKQRNTEKSFIDKLKKNFKDSYLNTINNIFILYELELSSLNLDGYGIIAVEIITKLAPNIGWLKQLFEKEILSNILIATQKGLISNYKTPVEDIYKPGDEINIKINEYTFSNYEYLNKYLQFYTQINDKDLLKKIEIERLTINEENKALHDAEIDEETIVEIQQLWDAYLTEIDYQYKEYWYSSRLHPNLTPDYLKDLIVGKYKKVVDLLLSKSRSKEISEKNSSNNMDNNDRNNQPVVTISGNLHPDWNQKGTSDHRLFNNLNIRATEMAHRRPEDIETNEDARLPKQKGGTRAKKQKKIAK